MESVDIFIFGYASKIFNDNALAEEQQQGRTLIPLIVNETHRPIYVDR